MKCRKCSEEKLSTEFTTLRNVGPANDGSDGFDLNRYCLRCLELEVLKDSGMYYATISDEIKEHIQGEIDFLNGRRVYLGRVEEERIAQQQDVIDIRFLTGELVSMTVEPKTRIKDIKLYLGELQQMEPRYYRLLYGEDDLEMKVRGEDGSAVLLSSYSDVRFITAILPYSKHAGQSHIDGAATDSYGNAQGNAFDLGVDGAFKNMTVAVLQLYTGEGFTFAEPKAALEEKGFTVVLWQSAPPLAELERVLAFACQCWVISAPNAVLNADHLGALRAFYERGKGLYIWGDNQPYYADANALLAVLFPGQGVNMVGNDPGQVTIKARPGPTQTGIDAEHIIFTGIENLYEGITIARVQAPPNTGITPIAISSSLFPVTSVLDDGKHRLAIDGGYTRMYPQFWNVSAGTSRFVKNISAWLVGIDADWVED